MFHPSRAGVACLVIAFTKGYVMYLDQFSALKTQLNFIVVLFYYFDQDNISAQSYITLTYFITMAEFDACCKSYNFSVILAKMSNIEAILLNVADDIA